MIGKEVRESPFKSNNPEVVFRWIRIDTLKFSKKKIAGIFKAVKRIKNGHYHPRINKGKFKGCIGIGGLVLARVNMDKFYENAFIFK